MFSKIFKPKWQHRKTEVRIAALCELDVEDPILLQLAASDAAPAVRRQAMRRINDPGALLRLVADEQDEETRLSGERRVKRLLSGEEDGCPDLTARRQLLRELKNDDVLGYVLKHAAEIELRETALEGVTRPSILADVALSDPSGELRLTALTRIERPATLERVAKQAKGKDKRVARLARERLEAIQLEAERPERQGAICEAIEKLVAQGGVDLIAFDRQQKAWHSILPVASDELSMRYESACEAFAQAQARFKYEAALMARQRELCEEIEVLQQSVTGEQVDSPAMDVMISTLQQRWHSLAEESQELNPALVERFGTALDKTKRLLADQVARQEEIGRLEGIIEKLSALTAKDHAFYEGDLERIESEWRTVAGTSKTPHHSEHLARFEQLRHRAKKQLVEQEQEKEQLKAGLAELMSELETALDEGQLQQASSCHDKVRDRLARLKALGGTQNTSQHKRLNKAAGRLRELRDWRRFGTNRARDELLEQMQALAESELAPLKLAEAVKALRNEWRRLDRRDGPPPEALWQAFDVAAETAYAPCIAHFEALQEERNEHMDVRQRFLDELEQTYAGIDWQSTDWGEVERSLQQAKKRWPKLGGVEAKAWQEVNNRFRQIIGQYEKQLDPQREREIHRREGLIKSVERLVDEPDLDKALAETKSAQSAWRPMVSAQPRVERALWQRFKAACDAVYARQRAQTQARREAEQVEHKKLEALCGELEELASSLDVDSLSQGRARLAGLKQEWDEAQQHIRRQKSLVQRYEAGMKAFSRAEHSIAQREAEKEQDLLMEKMALCESLEERLFKKDARSGIDDLVHSLEALPALRDSRFEEALSTRFQLAHQALQEGEEATTALISPAAENLARCQSLCLQLELLAGVESPAAFAEERLAMQVEMLPGAMTGHLAGPGRDEEIHQLLGDYLAVGPVPPAERRVLKERIQAVLGEGASD